MSLTAAERAQLRSLCNRMETLLQIGKEGVTPAVIRQADETLTARELFKGCVLETAGVTAAEAAAALAEPLKAETVQVIGRRFALYRENPEKPTVSGPLKQQMRARRSKGDK